jgi:hypothetical protein
VRGETRCALPGWSRRLLWLWPPDTSSAEKLGARGSGGARADRMEMHGCGMTAYLNLAAARKLGGDVVAGSTIGDGRRSARVVRTSLASQAWASVGFDRRDVARQGLGSACALTPVWCPVAAVWSGRGLGAACAVVAVRGSIVAVWSGRGLGAACGVVAVRGSIVAV